MFGRKNPFFSWSPYRERMFKDCELCYIMHYYTAHKGWNKGSSTEARASYRWKTAKSLEELTNREFLNHLMEEVHSDSGFSSKNLRLGVINALNKAFNDSVSNKDKWYDNPKSVNMIYELVYTNKLDKKIVNDTSNKIDKLIAGFTKTKFIEELKEDDSEILKVREKFRGGFTYYTIEKLGIRAYAEVQTVHKRADGAIVASLFKTNSDEATLSQLGAITNVVRKTLEDDNAKIIIREEFLLTGKSKENVMSDKLIELTELAILDSVEMMKAFLVNGDLERNQFKGFKTANYHRSLEHNSCVASNDNMHECPYCEAVRSDIQLYPKGYDKRIDAIRKMA